MIAVIENNENEVRCIEGSLLSNYVFVIKFFHDFDLLFDVFLEEGFLLDLSFGNDFYGIELLLRFLMNGELLLRERRTYPKAPFPMDLTTS